MYAPTSVLAGPLCVRDTTIRAPTYLLSNHGWFNLLPVGVSGLSVWLRHFPNTAHPELPTSVTGTHHSFVWFFPQIPQSSRVHRIPEISCAGCHEVSARMRLVLTCTAWALPKGCVLWTFNLQWYVSSNMSWQLLASENGVLKFV